MRPAFSRSLLPTLLLGAGLLLGPAFAEAETPNQPTPEARGMKRFQKLDANQDGKLSLAELEAGILAQRSKRQERRSQRKAKREKRLGEKGLSPEEIQARKAKHAAKKGAKKAPRLDRDGDGTISAEELAQLAQKRFAKMDQNGDGTVTLEEFQAHAAQAKQRHGSGRKPHRKGRRGKGKDQDKGPDKE